jgi:hypothetical protein
MISAGVDEDRSGDQSPNMKLAAALSIAITFIATTSEAEPPLEPNTVAFALMSGTCSTLKIAGHVFSCKVVSFYQNELGRANFTVVLDDPTDDRHIITFSGDNGLTKEGVYELPIDRMLLKSKDRPKMDGLPIPAMEISTGACKQLGSIVKGWVSNISCNATDRNGNTYELQFDSDGSPVSMWHVRPSKPTIRQNSEN